MPKQTTNNKTLRKHPTSYPKIQEWQCTITEWNEMFYHENVFKIIDILKSFALKINTLQNIILKFINKYAKKDKIEAQITSIHLISIYQYIALCILYQLYTSNWCSMSQSLDEWQILIDCHHNPKPSSWLWVECEYTAIAFCN